MPEREPWISHSWARYHAERHADDIYFEVFHRLDGELDVTGEHAGRVATAAVHAFRDALNRIESETDAHGVSI